MSDLNPLLHMDVGTTGLMKEEINTEKKVTIYPGQPSPNEEIFQKMTTTR